MQIPGRSLAAKLADQSQSMSHLKALPFSLVPKALFFNM
jgi:hypothetical protein